MKKIILNILVSLFILTMVGCDESFSPKGKFKEGYSLFCVIDGNSSTQKAYITSNYNPSGLDPGSYSEDKSIAGAKLELSNSDTNYTFFDTTLVEDDGNNYTAYYLKNFTSTNDIWKIAATMPDGSSLISEVKCPGNLRFVYETIKGISFDLEGVYRVAFYDRTEPFYFSPKLFINYSLKKGNEYIPYKIEVPRRYLNIGNKEIPVYPEPGSRNEYVYPIISIEKTLRTIVDVVPPGSNIFIENLTLEVLELSDVLAFYYEINKTFSDGFTVKSQQPSYTNIEGGNGLFGCKFTSKLIVGFSREWQEAIMDMGYILVR